MLRQRDVDTTSLQTIAVVQPGGFAGYKQGGIGAAPPDPCAYGVLFGCGLVDLETDPAASLSRADYHIFGIESEVGFVMGTDLAVKLDGACVPMATTFAFFSRTFFPLTSLSLSLSLSWHKLVGVACRSAY